MSKNSNQQDLLFIERPNFELIDVVGAELLDLLTKLKNEGKRVTVMTVTGSANYRLAVQKGALYRE